MTYVRVAYTVCILVYMPLDFVIRLAQCRGVVIDAKASTLVCTRVSFVNTSMKISFATAGVPTPTALLGETLVMEELDSLGILYTVTHTLPLTVIVDDYDYAVFALQWISDKPYKRYKVLAQY